MAPPSLTAGNVVDRSAALLNDAAKTTFTFAAQLPYLNMALQELQEFFELNEVPVTDTVSAVIQVNSGVSSIGFSAVNPHLPDNLIEPQILWERQRDTNPYTPMTRLDSLPRYMEGIEINQLIYYVWQNQEVRFLPANTNIDIKMDYIRNLFATVTAAGDDITILNAATFLEYRTAALCAFFIGQNKTRSDELNVYAGLGMDRVLGIGAKGRQSIMTRHRPFRSSYKRRTYS